MELINSNQINCVFFDVIRTVDDVVNTCSNVIVKAMSKSYLAWIEECESFTVNEYYDSYILNNIIFDSKISQLNNESFDMLLDEILSEIFSQLDMFGKNDSVQMNVGINKDIEDPDWEEFVISIKILPKNATNYEEYYTLLDRIIEKVRYQISLSEIQDTEILEKYGDPIIVFDVCE